MGEYNEQLCDEKHKNIWGAITDLQERMKSLRSSMAVFNTTGIGILVAIITSLIINHIGSK
jgi:cell division protein ZapA (FtsZ GTPase activity inhibitor)